MAFTLRLLSANQPVETLAQKRGVLIVRCAGCSPVSGVASA
jgi:hypothetical protein